VHEINATGSALRGNVGSAIGPVYHDKLYFAADDGMHGAELWVSDLTDGGTRLLSDINAGTTGSSPGNFLIYRDRLQFSADDGQHGTELWQTDGSAANTQLVGDLHAGPAGSDAYPMAVLGNDLILAGSEGLRGREPWRYTAP
jgi:ELWxxDGT repeat protein